MRQRSETWAKLAARGRFNVDVKAVIGGVEYTAISAPIIERSLFSDEMSVGNCIAASMKIAVLTEDEIAKAAAVRIKARLCSGNTYSEWKDFGLFYVAKREKDEGLVSLQCYDAMLKANQQYVDPSNPDDRIGWPKSMQTCVREIAHRIGVEIDSRTAIHAEEHYQVAYPTNYTMQQVLGYIGACHGGNWIITPENRLRLVPLISPPPETFDIVDYDYNKIRTDDGYKLVWKHCETDEIISNNAGGEVINVPVVIDKITTGKSMIISRVTIARDKELGYTEGDDTGVELRINDNPYANQAICSDLFTTLNGIIYAPFTAEGACYDPCTELGDWILIGDQVRSVLFHQTTTLGIDFRSTIAAPGKDETSDEYPYLTEIEKLHIKDEQLQKYIDTAKDEIDSQILQTRTSILLEVAGTYATQENVSSDLNILAGKIVAEVKRSTAAEENLEGRLTISEKAISAEVTRAKNEEETLSSSINVALEKIELKVSVGDVSSQISVESGKVNIGANRLTIQSDNFTLNGSGTVTAKGSITTESGSSKSVLNSGGLFFYYSDSLTSSLQANAVAGSDFSGLGTNHRVLKLGLEQDAVIVSSGGSYFFAFNNGLDPNGNGDRIWVGGSIHVDGTLHQHDPICFCDYYGAEKAKIMSMGSSTDSAYGVYVDGNLYATGNLWCSGEKYRTVDTKNFGTVGLNAVESAVAVFSDIGCGTIDSSGVAYVYFDPVFAETVDPNHEYQVFICQCGPAAVSYVEKNTNHFIVYGQPGAVFDWMIFARQKGYATHRLENAVAVKDEEESADHAIFYDDDKGANLSEAYMKEFADTIDDDAAVYLRNFEQEVLENDN